MRHQFARFGFSEEITRYILVALSALVVDIVLINILKETGLSLNWTLLLAYAGGTLWNYYWSKRWVYAYQRLNGRLSEPLIFWGLSFASFFGSFIIIQILLIWNVDILAAKLLAEVIVGALGFTSKKLLLFTNYRSLSSTYKLYKTAPLTSFLHVMYRRISLPLKNLLKYMPANAHRIAEIGTGHGLVINSLALSSKKTNHQVFYGCDIDGAKLAIAQQAADNSNLNISFGTKLPESNWNVILIVDVLYLLSETEQQKLLTKLTPLLNRGGCLLVKEMAFKPRWKFMVVRCQERLSVRMFGITKTSYARPRFNFCNLDELSDVLQKQNFQTQLIRLDRGWIYPHYLLKAVQGSH